MPTGKKRKKLERGEEGKRKEKPSCCLGRNPDQRQSLKRGKKKKEAPSLPARGGKEKKGVVIRSLPLQSKGKGGKSVVVFTSNHNSPGL